MSQSTGEGRRPQLQMLWPEERLKAPPRADLAPGYEMRTFRPEDAEGCLRLMAAAGFEGWDEARLAQCLRTVLPDGLFVIVEGSRGGIVATAMATHNPSELHPYGGELGWVAADPEHSGRGLGTAVCSGVTSRFLDMGYRRIYLKTDDWRLPALKVYLKVGYVPFLFETGMRERWQAVCERLSWPFAPEGWPKIERVDGDGPEEEGEKEERPDSDGTEREDRDPPA